MTRLHTRRALRYTAAVAPKKGVIGCESPKMLAAQSRNRTTCGFFVLAPVFGGPNGRAQARRLMAPPVSRSLTPVRAAAQCESWSAVVHLTQLELTMANTATGASAHATTTPAPTRKQAYEATARHLGLDGIAVRLAAAGAFTERDPVEPCCRMQPLRTRLIGICDAISEAADDAEDMACAIELFLNDVLPNMGSTPWQVKAVRGLLQPMANTARAQSAALQACLNGTTPPVTPDAATD